jgi:demethylmenaquinone methyltransferase/2-methoxy-6-polyprenyl-1,4-benzoquinol methylase
LTHDKRFVRDAFASIAPRYDLLNTLLSLGVESIWRRRVVSLLDAAEDEQVLDLCAGTLTVSRDIMNRSRRTPQVTAVDFCTEMLALGRSRLEGLEATRIRAVCGDAESLPLRSGKFDAAVVTYGIRNLADVSQGLAELHRVLRPGGRLVILDFLRPTLPGFAAFYRFYLKHVLPRIGGLISGSRDAYKHLSDSIHGFMDPGELQRRLTAAGFDRVSLERRSFGIAGLFHAVRA